MLTVLAIAVLILAIANLFLLALCVAVARGQRPMAEIQREAEEKRH
jgi:hypothetical protein